MSESSSKFFATFTLDTDMDLNLVEEILKEALTTAKVSVRKGSAKRTRLGDEQKAEIIQDRKDGMTYKELAYKFGVSKVVINKILRAAGLTKAWARKSRVQIVAEERIEEAQEAHVFAPTFDELAEIEALAE